jgi:carboxyl-terminal processing protease
MKKARAYILGAFGGIALLVSLAYTPDYFEISKQLDIFTNVFKEVNLYYVDETAPGELMQEAISSMLSTLDPYTNYIPEEYVEDFKIQNTGNYGGIGASITIHEEQVIITSIYEGFAADKAGIKVGDLLLTVDENTLTGKSSEDISKILKGAAGSEIKLELKRAEETLSKTLKRTDVQEASVPYYGMLNEHVGYITLSSFTPHASREVKKALTALKKEHELKGLVFDLRGNPGGLLNEAVNISNIFIPKGKDVVETRGKVEEWRKTYKTLNLPDETELPVAVLINRGSASASEIVAGVLQDYDRGVIIGQRSFGKGLVQQTRPLSFGAQMKVTIAKYYTPSGRCIQAINYAERDEDGSVKAIPDSLRNNFKTAAGRSVLDGGGIDPDIEVELEEINSLVVALYRKMLLFDYATLYARKHADISNARGFKLTEAEYTDFTNWVKTKGLEYETPTEKAISKLEKKAEQEEYLENLKSELAALKKAYDKSEQRDLEKYKDVIKELLEEEISARFYYEKGRIANAIQKDAEVLKAVEVLEDPVLYNRTLSVAKD